MAQDLRLLLEKCRQIEPEPAAAEALFWENVKHRARQGDLLSYILYVHGEKHRDIRSFCFSKHAWVMATHMEGNARTLIVAHPESGKTLLHRSDMEQWIGMQTEMCFAVNPNGSPKHPDVPPPSGAYIMGTKENQAEPQVHDIRNTIEFNKKYRELFPRARPDKKEGWEKGNFFLKRPPERTRPESTLIAMGCEGDIQGGRYGKMVIDDPISQKDAKSDTIVRDRVRYILGTLERRVLEEGDTRYVFTRWRERDAFPPLATTMPTLVMPVYGFWEDHPEYGYEADTLWPEKWPKARVEIERNKLIGAGEAPLFDLVWMCNPKLAEGNLFKRAWLRYGQPPKVEVAV